MIAWPIDPDTEKKWSIENIRLVQAKFWREAEEELRVQDVERSGGRLSAATGYKCTEVYSVQEDKAGNKIEKLRVNNELSRLKHSGRDRRRLYARKWLDFMENTPPESDIKTLVVADEHEKELAKIKKFAESKDEVPEPVIA